MKNWVNWFEIPVSDISRASAFYANIFDVELHTVDMMGTKMAIFPHEGSGGALVQGSDYTPSAEGSLVYLNGGEDLTGVLEKVEGAGGKVIVPKTHIGDGLGYFALFIDTEGNKLALHSTR